MGMRKKNQMGLFEIVQYIVLAATAILCVLPFIIIVSGSFSDNDRILKQGYGIFPRGFTTAAYQMIAKLPQGILQGYKMTLYYMVVGTLVATLIITLTAYVLSRKTFKYRNHVSFIIYFTTIFGGGLIPWYLMYANVLNLKGTTPVMWLPAVFDPFLVIVLRTFIKGSVPDEIVESATIDGAGHATIFSRIVIPIILPGLATVVLFKSLAYWNDWYFSSVFSMDSSTWELQYYLYNLVGAQEAMTRLAEAASLSDMNLPGQTVKLAMAVAVTGPILLFYPFMQRFFIKGITIGSVKG